MKSLTALAVIGLWLLAPRGYSQPFAYNGNAQTGYGPILGGPANNWVFSLTRVANTFYAGDHVYGLLHVGDISVNHGFTVGVFKDGISVNSYLFGTNSVDGNTWSTAYCWAEQNNVSPGNWEFRISVFITVQPSS